MSLLKNFLNRNKQETPKENTQDFKLIEQYREENEKLKKQVKHLQTTLKDIDENFMEWYEKQNEVHQSKEVNSPEKTREELIKEEDKEFNKFLDTLEWDNKE